MSTRSPPLGSHLVAGCLVNTTAELGIVELPHLDSATGYGEFSVQARASQG